VHSAQPLSTLAALATSPAMDMKTQRLARLVIEAECTTCGRVGDEADGMSIVQLALEHTVATGHVVILNGTTDVPVADEPAATPFGNADLMPPRS
jgi:hypothetical protein